MKKEEVNPRSCATGAYSAHLPGWRRQKRSNANLRSTEIDGMFVERAGLWVYNRTLCEDGAIVPSCTVLICVNDGTANSCNSAATSSVWS